MTFDCLFILACQDAPVAPDVSPQFLIGQFPLSPIWLDTTADPRELFVPLTVNRGTEQVAIEDKFVVRLAAEFKVADCEICTVGPQYMGVIGQKDTEVRQGSDVAIVTSMAAMSRSSIRTRPPIQKTGGA